ncbi:class I SAM-dependent methyltransferase [Nocardia sp. NPDC058658]|uniref:class I SAM-dependent methyltransferase n=1 Tax=Nocardia sp. NPDC058658 TaxID=3346580 RepID=UPI0036656C1A
MAETEPVIASVVDTARWTAVYRARESERADALFHDVLADRLAGERGRAIAAQTARLLSSGWPVVARTKLIDDLVLAAVENGCDRVLSIAAGFDTRPYRLALPPELVWVEAELPELLEEKERLLADEQPRCVLRRSRVDLSDAQARAAFLDEALAGASKALVVTESLVMYLAPEDVRQLADDLRRPEITGWVVDVASKAVARMVARGSRDLLRNAPFKFMPDNGIGFFEDHGWSVAEIEPVMKAANRFRRLPPLLRLYSLFPQPNLRKSGRLPWTAVALLRP